MITFLGGILQSLQRVSFWLYAITTCLHTSVVDDLLHLYNSPQTYPLISRVMTFASFFQSETVWENGTIAGSALLIGLEIGYRFAEYQHNAAWFAEQYLYFHLVRLVFFLSWCVFAASNTANQVMGLLALLRSLLFLLEFVKNAVPEPDPNLIAEQSEVENVDEDDDGYRRYYDRHHYDPRYESDYESDHDYMQSKYF